MRVLFLSPAAQLGGAERCLLDCVRALNDAPGAPIESSVLSLFDGPLLEKARELGAETSVVEPPPVLAQLGEAGVGRLSVLLRSAVALSSSLPFLVALRRAIAAARPDIVHTNGMKAHVLGGALAPSSARLAVHLHDFVGRRGTSKDMLALLSRVRPSSVFIANSAAVAADFAVVTPRANVQTVLNVVDCDYFCPGVEEPAWLAEQANLAAPSEDTLSFGLVATYARWKGHELFIRSAGRLRAAHPSRSFRFYVVGGPIYRTEGSQVGEAELLGWAREAGIADCFGLIPFRDDVPRVYRSLNVVVHASTEPEPFGRTIVEAMACARVVLVADAGGARELFQHGKNAYGYALGSEGSLTGAMASVLRESDRAQLGQRARAHAVSHFGAARLPAQLLQAYGQP